MEDAEYYYTDPNKEILQNSLILGLQQKEQAFLIRLYEWRRSEAERKNYSKEMILPAKYIGAIVRGTKAGKNALLNHRRLPNKLIENHWNTFYGLYDQPISDNEKTIIASIPPATNENNQDDTLIEMLSLIIRYLCNEKNIAPDILIPRSSYKKMKVDPNYFDENIGIGWRRKLIGDRMVEWLKNRDRLQLILEDDKFTLGYKNKKAQN
jgi:ribonuclease D